MSGPYENQQSPRPRVRRVPSLTLFKGHDIDPNDLQPFHFNGQSQNACCQGTEYLEEIVQRRDISGRTKEFLRLIQTKYKQGKCTTVQGRARDTLAREVKILENMWESHWEKVYGPSSDRARFHDLSEELKELKFLAILGDYAAIFCKEIRNLGLGYPINGFKQWRDVEESLSKEDVALEEWKSNTEWDLPEQPLHDSIEAVAHNLTPPVQAEMVRFWIRIYAERNETFHCGVHEALEVNDWQALGSYILEHQKILPSIIPESHQADNVLVRKTVQRLQKKFFETLSEDPRPNSSGQASLGITTYGKELERRQQQQSASNGNTGL